MDVITNVLSWDWAGIITAVLAILGGFSALAKITPTQADDEVIDKIYKFINLLGLNKDA